MPTPELEVVVRDSAVSRGLACVIEKCINKLNGSYGKIISRVAEPQFIDYTDGYTRVNISEVTYSYVHCVFQLKGRTVFNWKRKRVLLFGISEPEVIFEESGTLKLSDMVCYVRNSNIKDVVQEEVRIFAETFNIKKITFILDSISSIQ